MKVVVVNLTSGGLSGGSKKYLFNVIPLLKKHNKISELNVFVPAQALKLFSEDHSVYTWLKNDSIRGFQALKRSIQQLNPDVVFFPSARWFNCGLVPTVTMVRNMEPLVIPFGGNPLSEILRNLTRVCTARKACKRADRIIAVSQFVREFLVKHWRIHEKKIGVVYHGLQPELGNNQFQKPKFKTEIKINQFIFTVGSIRPARGLEDVIRALSLIRSKNLHYKLVIAGGVDPGMSSYKNRLDQMARRMGISGSIVWTGHLNSKEVSWCFFNAAVFVMTSRVEACPNTALEAMAHSCLCISTRNPPMPEFFQDAALYYQAHNIDELADKICFALTIPSGQKTTYTKCSKLRANEFHWHNTVEKTVSQLEIAAGKISNIQS